MSRRRVKGAARVVAHVHEDPTRGGVFWFLYREHDAIVERAQGKRISWLTLLSDIRDLGLKNADGRILDSVETLKSTFKRVRGLKRREADAKQQRAAGRRRPTNDPPPFERPLPFKMTTQAQPRPSVAIDDDANDPLMIELLRRSNKRV